MAELGATADASTPYLRDLNASAGQLERFLDDLGPFAESSRGNVRTLAETADAGAARGRARAQPTVAELTKTTEKAPELANNLEIVLRDLDDRERAVEKDKRSPGGQGYTGFEAFLSYVFDQTMAINIFDENGHILKVNLSASECSEYQNADSLKRKEKESPGFISRCLAGARPEPARRHDAPTRPTPASTTPATSRRRRAKHARRSKPKKQTKQAKPSSSRARTRPASPTSRRRSSELLEQRRRREQARRAAPSLPERPAPATSRCPNVPAPERAEPDPGRRLGGQSADPQALLDYLLSP